MRGDRRACELRRHREVERRRDRAPRRTPAAPAPRATCWRQASSRRASAAGYRGPTHRAAHPDRSCRRRRARRRGRHRRRAGVRRAHMQAGQTAPARLGGSACEPFWQATCRAPAGRRARLGSRCVTASHDALPGTSREPHITHGAAAVDDSCSSALRPIGVSSLGFGAHHDENVLAAIAAAGSGRYAYIPDPVLARVELARAALAHGGIVAEQLELELRPAAGVELVQLLPKAQLRVRRWRREVADRGRVRRRGARARTRARSRSVTVGEGQARRARDPRPRTRRLGARAARRSHRRCPRRSPRDRPHRAARHPARPGRRRARRRSRPRRSQRAALPRPPCCVR